jgi:HK97 family phage portal protein
MGFWRNIINRLTRDQRYVEVSRVPWWGKTKAGIRVDADTALQNATVWACVTYLGRTVGQLPWRVMRTGDGGAQRSPTHPVQYVLSGRPNPELPPLAFREQMTGWAATWGNAVAEITRDARGLARELWPIHPSRVTFARDEVTNELVYDVQNDIGGIRRLRSFDVFHIRGYGDGPVGLNVVAYAAESIGWARATEIFGASYFGDGATPSGQILLPQGTKIAPGGLDLLRASFKAIYGGGGRGERTVVLDQGMKFEAISRAPEEGQFVETRQHQVEEICRWFGVPPHKVMHLLHAHFTNIEHQSIEVVVDSIAPWVTRFEEEAEYKLFGPANRGAYYTELDLKGLQRGDFKSRAEGYRILRELGVLSVDEIRSEEGWNPIGEAEGGEKRMVPLNFTTLERFGEEPASAPPRAPAALPAPDDTPTNSYERATRVANALIDRAKAKQ